jgi:hypothetical protein
MRAHVDVQLPAHLEPVSTTALDAVVRNLGRATFPPDGARPVTLGYRWLRPEGQGESRTLVGSFRC